MQKTVNEARAKGAAAVVLLSHNGMDVDLKLASRVSGIDAILGGHTHDGVPQPIVVKNGGGQTLVTNAGSNGKFLGVLDLEVKDRRVTDFRYRLLPVFSRFLPADADMMALIERARAPQGPARGKLAVTEGLLYRRGNFNGTLTRSSSTPCWRSRVPTLPSRPVSAGAPRACCPDRRSPSSI